MTMFGSWTPGHVHHVCDDCGAVTAAISWHSTVAMTGKPGKPHHHGTYARRARAVRAAANADTRTRCWRCGLTHAEYAAQHGHRAARWTAGHVIDGQVDGELRAEHARCNHSAGAAHGNRMREPHSEAWY